MSPCALSDADFDRLAPLVPGRPGADPADDRRLSDAVVWTARTGVP